jgi:nucleotide-binding universal stress UspA family protein
VFSRFIVATDLSPASFALVRSLAGLRAFGARQCLLLNCLSLGESTAMALSLTHEAVESNLERQKRSLEEQGFITTASTVFGFAKTEINRIAEKQNYPLIVVGSHGQTLIGTDLLGGVASAVIHNATKPVLVVRLEVKQGRGEVCIQAVRPISATTFCFPPISRKTPTMHSRVWKKWSRTVREGSRCFTFRRKPASIHICLIALRNSTRSIRDVWSK